MSHQFRASCVPADNAVADTEALQKSTGRLGGNKVAVSLCPASMKCFFAISAGVIAAFWMLIFGMFWIPCYQNTLYSERFSKAAFAGITIGMPRASVIDALGAPLETHTEENYPVWALANEATRIRYGKDKQITLESLIFSKPKDDSLDFNYVSVLLGPDSTVIDVSSYLTD